MDRNADCRLSANCSFRAFEPRILIFVYIMPLIINLNLQPGVRENNLRVT
jgi:hypothetical protein